jgi:hypothetical protein
VGQGCFAGARRSIKDQRAKPVSLQHPAQQFAGTEEVVLADKLVHATRAHPRRQRLCFAQVRLVNLVKQIDGAPPCPDKLPKFWKTSEVYSDWPQKKNPLPGASQAHAEKRDNHALVIHTPN